MNSNLSLTAAKVALRISGIANQGDGSRTALSALRQLKPRLQALSTVLPNMGKTFELILRLTQLNDSRVRVKAAPDQKRPVKGGVINFVSWLLRDPGSPLQRDHPYQEAETELLLDVVALRWVYSSAMRSFSDQVYDGFQPQQNSPNQDFEYLLDALLSAEQPQPSLPAALKTGYQAWFSEVKAVAPSSALSDIFSRLQNIIEIDFLKPKNRDEVPMPRMSERMLCKSHWLYPRPHELEQLHRFLSEQLDSYQASKKRHEAGLIALSITLGRPIQAFLDWRIVTHLTEANKGKNCIALSDYSGHWLKAEHGVRDAVAKVPLSFSVSLWLNSIHPGPGRPTLHDLLPYSKVAWDQRAYTCLADHVGCDPSRAELITRDLLSREMYSITCNSALIDFWRNDGINKIERPDRIALSHYLQPNGHRMTDSYSRSVKNSTGLDLPNPPDIQVNLGSAPLQLEEVRKILAILHKSKEDASIFSEKHNTTAFWSIFIILLATGHRRSTTPFPFPWDFSPSEGLVFICDKLVTGSEARFVPMAPLALTCLADYAAHLKKIANSVSVKQPAKNYALQTLALLGLEKELSALAKPSNFLPDAGVFFLLSNDGLISTQRLTTNALDRFIEERTGMRHTVRRLRTTMAQHLWEAGASGRAIQAFLGHQPEMHAHGPESTWSVQDLAEMLLPKINAYLEDALNPPKEKKSVKSPYVRKFVKVVLDAQPSALIKSPWTFPSHFVSIQVAPSVADNGKLTPGYEGRERESVWAEQRVRAAIRREVSQYMLEVQEPSDAPSPEGNGITQFTPEDRQRIEARVRAELGTDPVGLKKVNAALDIIIDKSLRARGLSVQTDPNYRLSSPGPIEISFSRALRCALVLRGLWEQNVGVPISRREFDPLERLAHLAISLVCFDAVLADDNLAGLVMTVVEQGSKSLGTNGTVRCHVVTPSHDYEFSVRPGMISKALIFGCRSEIQDASEVDWQQIEERVEEVLHRLCPLHNRMKWSISKLCQVFRPYWLIRLPGAMYSVATGEHKGPAADARAEAQLQGIKLPSEVQSTSTQPPKRSSREQDQKSALSALRKLLSTARGILELGEQRARAQRRRLRECLHSDLAVQVIQHGQDSQIVGLLLSFLGRLLDSGGPVKSRLAFSTIESYFSPIAEALIELAWDFDFESADGKELMDLFNGVQMRLKINHADLVLRLFGNHLRDELSIAPFNPRWFSAREPVRIRSSLVTPDHVGDAMERLHKKGDETSRNAATFIALCFGYGLRRNEAFGLKANCFDTRAPSHLSVKRSAVSDLKSTSGRRAIAGSINRKAAINRVTNAVATARESTRHSAFIFESLTRDAVITPVRPITASATDALRVATGSLKVVPHTLRHSYATLLGLGLFAKKARGSLPELECLKIFHSQSAPVIQLDGVLSMPTDWPFGVDAIATALGHADCSTLLNVYFHGSHLVIANRSEPWQFEKITQARLAEALNMERTALSKQWGKFAKGRKFDARAMVGIVIKADSTSKPAGRVVSEVSDDSVWSPTRWDLVIRLLEHRQEKNLSLEGLRAFAIDGFGFSSETLDSLLSTYQGLVQETSFDDFEPTSSELITPVASHQNGVGRGANERRDFIARAQAWANASDANAANLRALLENWKSRLNKVKPLIVCRNMGELNQWLGLLGLLDAHPDQLAIGLHGDVQDAFLEEVLALYPLSDVISKPASRGSARLKRNEVSISVRQRPNSRVPDGRDLHRALVGLYVPLCSSKLH